MTGLAAQLELTGRSLKSALKHADRIGARYVAIVNNMEQTSLKQMDSGEQDELATGTVIPTILRGSRLA
jgi:histidyl-tRNA synthetase